MLTTTVGRLRLIGIIEGLSFLLLMMIAMPKKYFFGDPTWVTHSGRIPGLLWVVFCFALLDAKVKEGWTIKQALIPFIASMLPFGPFLVDRRIKEGRL